MFLSKPGAKVEKKLLCSQIFFDAEDRNYKNDTVKTETSRFYRGKGLATIGNDWQKLEADT